MRRVLPWIALAVFACGGPEEEKQAEPAAPPAPPAEVLEARGAAAAARQEWVEWVRERGAGEIDAASAEAAQERGERALVSARYEEAARAFREAQEEFARLLSKARRVQEQVYREAVEAKARAHALRQRLRDGQAALTSRVAAAGANEKALWIAVQSIALQDVFDNSLLLDVDTDLQQGDTLFEDGRLADAGQLYVRCRNRLERLAKRFEAAEPLARARLEVTDLRASRDEVERWLLENDLPVRLEEADKAIDNAVARTEALEFDSAKHTLRMARAMLEKARVEGDALLERRKLVASARKTAETMRESWAASARQARLEETEETRAALEQIAAGDLHRDRGDLDAAVRSYQQAARGFREASARAHEEILARMARLRAKPTPAPKPPGPWASSKAADAARLALVWLARHQDDDGRWDCDAFTKHDAGGSRTGGGVAFYDVGVTGLALLCFLESGYSDRGEEDAAYWAINVGQGLRWLLSVQDEEGVFGTRAFQHFIYGHAAATHAMVEAYTATKDPEYRAAAQKGVDFILAARNPGLAWRYEPRGNENDTSVTVWCVRVLHAAGQAGLQTEPEALRGALAWVDKMTDPEFGQVGYNFPGGVPSRPQALVDRFPPDKTQSMTAAGVLIRLLAGERINENRTIRKGIDLLLETPPVWDAERGTIDMIYWHYATLALRRIGGRSWSMWRSPMREVCMERQRGGGNDTNGSWDPIGVWGEDGGRVYSTAMMTLILLDSARGR